MSIVKNKKGDIFLDLVKDEEANILGNEKYKPLTHSLVIIKCGGKYLLVFDKWKGQWEVPGGGIKGRETPRECAIREVYEETNLKLDDLEFIGIMKFSLQPDQRIEYGALYAAEISGLNEFAETDEIKKIILWDLQEDIGYVDEIDKKLLEYY
ncbi:MAG: NUDIX domain-containing protein [Firmicutes bacterium]|nr:NUDIX domain-containing protein [Bacillota bacterium]